jgi:hypothetical protein
MSFWLTIGLVNTPHFPICFDEGFNMSEIRPASPRPESPRLQQERPVKNEQKAKEPSPQKTETHREVVRQDVNANNKPKGGKVDITV